MIQRESERESRKVVVAIRLQIREGERESSTRHWKLKEKDRGVFEMYASSKVPNQLDRELH